MTGGLPNHSLFALPVREARVGARWRSDADAVNDLRSNASREADGADALTLDTKIRILLGRYPNWSRENWKKHT